MFNSIYKVMELICMWFLLLLMWSMETLQRIEDVSTCHLCVLLYLPLKRLWFFILVARGLSEFPKPGNWMQKAFHKKKGQRRNIFLKENFSLQEEKVILTCTEVDWKLHRYLSYSAKFPWKSDTKGWNSGQLFINKDASSTDSPVQITFSHRMVVLQFYNLIDRIHACKSEVQILMHLLIKGSK